MQSNDSETATTNSRIPSIDFLRGLVMVIMALDHVRMFFGLGTWYAEPTDLSSTTPLLFFTRWITHFCAPVFVFLAGTSAFLYGRKLENAKHLAWFLFTRGLWLIFVEIAVVTFGWTFDVTYSFIILQVIWAIGISMVVLSALVFLPWQVICSIGIILVFGHNLLDPIHLRGRESLEALWYVLHQPQRVSLGEHLISIVYPVLPWIGLMALGYVLGNSYTAVFSTERRRWLVVTGLGATILFVFLRSFHFYGEPMDWQRQDSRIFTLMSFLNTTKYPPSLQFLLMTMGPTLIFLAWMERLNIRAKNPLVVFGKVPFFFYVIHIYLIHALAMFALGLSGRDPKEYILSAGSLMSGRLNNFGFGLATVYAVWLAVLLALYPLCRWYQEVRENHPTRWWLRYL